MQIPEGYTEAEVLEILDRIVIKLSYIYRFGYHELEDIQQEGKILGLEALAEGKYDPSRRNLDAYLYTYIHNRLSNFKRDNYARLQPPCISCQFYDKHCKQSVNQCTEFEDKMECDKWNKWITRNEAKKNLNHPCDLDELDENNTNYLHKIVDKVDMNDRLSKINSKMPISMRGDFLRMKDGASVPKNRKDAIIKFIKGLFDE